MKGYRYTIESVGGVTTVINGVPNKIDFLADAPFINIINPKGRIIEEEVEV